jgi:hypothetical protein
MRSALLFQRVIVKQNQYFQLVVRDKELGLHWEDSYRVSCMMHVSNTAFLRPAAVASRCNHLSSGCSAALLMVQDKTRLLT